MKKSGFIAIRNQADSATLQLYFLDVIQDSYDWFFDETISKVQEIIDKVNYYKPSKIICTIDSVGGDAQVGMSIYNFLKAYQAKIEVEIIGLAGSIAAVLAQAANKGKLRIARNGFMMIHEASGICIGTASEIRQQADVVEKYTDQCADIFAQRTGKPKEDVLALFAGGDYWMTGTEAVQQGFADETFNDVSTDLNIAARLDTGKYKHMPPAVAALLNKETAPDETGEFTTINTLIMALGDKIKNLFKNHKPANAAAPLSTEEIGNIMQPALDEFETEVTNQVTNTVESDSVIEKIANKVKDKIPAPEKPAAPDVSASIQAMIDDKGDNPLKTFITAQITAATKTLTEENVAIKNQLTTILGSEGNRGASGNGTGAADKGYTPRGKMA